MTSKEIFAKSNTIWRAAFWIGMKASEHWYLVWKQYVFVLFHRTDELCLYKNEDYGRLDSNPVFRINIKHINDMDELRKTVKSYIRAWV